MRALVAAIIGFVTVGVASSCATDDTSNYAARLQQGSDAGSDASLSTSPPPGSGSGGQAGGGSCDKSFCPSSGAGVGCCMAANGPCGVDFGMGCVPSPGDGG